MSRAMCAPMCCFVLLVASCGGETSEPAAGGGSTGSEQAISGPPRPWADMNQADKRRYMAEVVEPAMRPLFQEYDSQRFADFGCETCHGSDMVARQFDMPNPAILALHPSGTPEQRQTVDRHPRMVRFMYNRVVPRMQRLLGMQAFDATTGEGFSCYQCHPRGGEPPATPPAGDPAPDDQGPGGAPSLNPAWL